jgi:hypothetical protein
MTSPQQPHAPSTLLRGLALLGGLMACGWSSAAEVEQVLAPCRAIVADAPRLACYDQLGRERSPAAPVPASLATPAQSAAPVAAAPRPVDAPAEFGLENRQLIERAKAQSGRIRGRFEGWVPGARIALQNGQIWQIVDDSRSSYDLDAPAVVIRRGMLGSFFMEIEGVSATPRVRRIQ